MPSLTVGPNSTFPTIQAAMVAASPGDTITLESGYGNESATITHDNITVQGAESSAGISLTLAPGVTNLQLAGASSISVFDNASNNTIAGNAGDNVITVTGGADVVDGGLGNDRLVIDYRNGTAAMNGTSATGFTAADVGSVTTTAGTVEHFTILAGSGDNTLTTEAGDDYIETAGAGDNNIHAGMGNNTVITGAGVDTIDVGNGNDTILAGDGANTITGLAGDKFVSAGAGADTITLTSGNNTIHAGDGANTITVTSGNNIIIAGSGVDTIAVTGGNNFIDAGDGANTLSTTSGDDTLVSGYDTDTITTGTGNDTIIVKGGTDGVTAGAGIDTLVVDYSAATMDVTSSPMTGTYNDGYAGSVTEGAPGTVTFDGIEKFDIRTGSGNDSITTGDGADTIHTGTGIDHVNAGGGADLIYGNAGDVIDGGEGADIDTLNLSGIGRHETILDPLNTQNGTVYLLDADGNRTGESLTFSNIERVVACFTPGTLIATPTGPRAIETLKKGDLVLTLDNGYKPIIWAGSKRLSGLHLSKDDALQPISIRRGALGNDAPNRDMLVSCQHRMMISSASADLLFATPEVLVRAKHLVSLPGIEQVRLKSITYLHIMFDQHELVLADGAWSESFQPGDRSIAGIDADQREELLKIFPEISRAPHLKDYCAARLTLKAHEARVLLSA